jgi:hypothetical protein
MRIIRVITVIMAVVFALNMAACCGPDTTEVKKTESSTSRRSGSSWRISTRPTRTARLPRKNTIKTKQDILKSRAAHTEKTG